MNDVISATNDTYRLLVTEATARQDAELRDLKANLRYDELSVNAWRGSLRNA
ncbi:hypothetical protein [Rhizobium sp. Leaf453]|uniref:hypothetical protein n=1 Tax=Rhizobium sp. Leaf453 TaxID=1736380 RepID=UPI001FCDFD02|nr:hypothetical protein [Rhizobium sp. Leaf453]